MAQLANCRTLDLSVVCSSPMLGSTQCGAYSKKKKEKEKDFCCCCKKAVTLVRFRLHVLSSVGGNSSVSSIFKGFVHASLGSVPHTLPRGQSEMLLVFCMWFFVC